MDARERKTAWQRNQRAAFKAEHGYSTTAHYGAGGSRKSILERDGYRCVKCGMSDEAHRALWGRPITIDHKDRDRSNNAADNLQTLCLRCHGSKDITPRLTARKVEAHKATVMALRSSGSTYQRIADATGFSIGAIWKWCKQWEGERT